MLHFKILEYNTAHRKREGSHQFTNFLCTPMNYTSLIKALNYKSDLKSLNLLSLYNSITEFICVIYTLANIK